jgi:hypothetical protein
MSDGRPGQDELEPAADENAELDEDEGLDDEDDLDEGAPRSSSGSRDYEPAPAKPMAQVRGRDSRAPATSSVHDASTSEDELPYIDDRFSKYWVGAIVAVFLLIVAYGILFGKAGALTPPTPSPTPSPSATPSLSASPVPSSSLTPAPSVTITPLSSVIPTACPTPTPAPTATSNPSPGC